MKGSKNMNLGTFDVDVRLQPNGKFDVYIYHNGDSGEHYPGVDANEIGKRVADAIECIAEEYKERAKNYRPEFIQVTNIVYDLDEESDGADLPKAIAVPANAEGAEADYISDKTGFCVVYYEVAGKISEKQAQIQKDLSEHGLHLIWEQFVPDDQSHVFFHGGDIATIQKGKALITLKANGDVIGSLQDSKGEEIDRFKDKSNQGDRHDTYQYIKTNEDLDKALKGNLSSPYHLVMEDSNWLEWFFDSKDEGGNIETDVFWSEVDDSNDIFEAVSDTQWLLLTAGDIEARTESKESTEPSL